MALVDSHCHLDFPDFDSDRAEVLGRMAAAGVSHALCVSVSLEDFPRVAALAEGNAHIWASAGVHPGHSGGEEPTEPRLVALARSEKVVAIGETGLDYHRQAGDLEWQRNRFRIHIRAACEAGLPLIIHTRDAGLDTLRILREEGAARVGGVMHCFTETWDFAQRAMEMGFLISFSGIITFRNATALMDVARKVPLERMLVETDCPYLAPVPYRGKRNEPAHVRLVAAQLSNIKYVSEEEVETFTSSNFFSLFQKIVQ